MRRRGFRQRTTMMVALVMILSLGSLGVGYAYWTTSLSITTTASSGNMTLEWIGDDDMIDCDELSITAPYAETTAWRDTGDPQLIQLQITDGFPGYRVRCEFFARNLATSTIPAELTGMWVGSTLLSASGACTNLDLAGDAQDDLRVCLYDGDGLLEIGEEENKAIRIEVLPGMPMSVPSMSFNARFVFEQAVP